MMRSWRLASVLGLVAALVAAPLHGGGERAPIEEALAARLPGAEGKRVEMTLRQAVELALTGSRAIRNSVLQREASRNSLRAADHMFRPYVDLAGTATVEDARSAERRTALDGGPAVRLALRSGGNVGLRLSGSATDTSGGGAARYGYGYGVTLSQPLLKGRGALVATSGQRFARMDDEQAGYGLEASVSDLITSTVFAYRDLLTAREAVAIEERSLEAARDLAAINEALIEAGRLPAVEKVQSETDIANRELSLLVTKNALAQVGLALVSLLDLDLDTEVVPVDSIAVEKSEVDPDEALRTLLARSPEYRSQLLSVEAARLALAVAANGRQVDLVATAGLSQDRVGSEWTRNLSAGLLLRHPLVDPGPDVAFVAARLALERAELALAKTEDTIRIDLRQRLRNLDVAWRRLGLAARARELTTRQLEIEKEKLQAGRSANFQVVRFQNDLDGARNGELAASIAYANEVSLLDRALGRTLAVWGVDLAGLSRSVASGGGSQGPPGMEGKHP